MPGDADRPWAHVDTLTVPREIPGPEVPPKKRHPVYNWLEEHGRRLDAIEAIGVGALAACLVFGSLTCWVLVIRVAVWWLGW